MQAPHIYQFSKGRHTRDGYEVTVGLSPYGKARLQAGLILLSLGVRLAGRMLAPFKIDIEVKA